LTKEVVKKSQHKAVNLFETATKKIASAFVAVENFLFGSDNVVAAKLYV